MREQASHKEVKALERRTTHLNKKQIAAVFGRQNSRQYEREGYRYALNVSNAFVLERIFAFALDTTVMFLPIMIWELCILMIIIGILPIWLLNPLEILTLVLLAISMLTFNAAFSVKSGGQTLGKYFYDLKVVKKNHREASNAVLAAREIIGFSVPTVVLFLFFNIIGVGAYWLLNFLFLLLHPKHISIIDLFLKTRIVVLGQTPRASEPVVEEPEPITEPEPAAHNTIDLHIHSHFSSDGEYNVEEIFQAAVKNGLKTISICDHNSVKANRIARQMAPLYHVNYVDGVELDCRFRDVELRVLGYFIDSTSDIFVHLENESLKREKNASLRRVDAFRKHTGILVDVKELLENNRFQRISGEMIAQYLLKHDEYHDHPLLEPYMSGEKSDDPIAHIHEDYFAEGAPCYIPIIHPKLEDILDIIHLTGGMAVLSWAKETLDFDEAFFNGVLEQGIEGIEVFTPYYTEAEMARLLRVAREHHLFVTAGSDFHGAHKPDIAIGETNCPPEAEKLVHTLVEVKEKSRKRADK